MYILCPKGAEQEGVYSVSTKNGPVLISFLNKDDAERYVLHMEGEEVLTIVEVDPELTIEMCEVNGYPYTVVGENDLVLPIEE